jgi:hypothetical protein
VQQHEAQVQFLKAKDLSIKKVSVKGGQLLKPSSKSAKFCSFEEGATSIFPGIKILFCLDHLSISNLWQDLQQI